MPAKSAPEKRGHHSIHPTKCPACGFTWKRLPGAQPKLTGEDIQAMRGMIRAGMTQTEIGRRLGVHKNTVGEWVRQERKAARRFPVRGQAAEKGPGKK